MLHNCTLPPECFDDVHLLSQVSPGETKNIFGRLIEVGEQANVDGTPVVSFLLRSDNKTDTPEAQALNTIQVSFPAMHAQVAPHSLRDTDAISSRITGVCMGPRPCYPDHELPPRLHFISRAYHGLPASGREQQSAQRDIAPVSRMKFEFFVSKHWICFANHADICPPPPSDLRS